MKNTIYQRKWFAAILLVALASTMTVSLTTAPVVAGEGTVRAVDLPVEGPDTP